MSEKKPLRKENPLLDFKQKYKFYILFALKMESPLGSVGFERVFKLLTELLIFLLIKKYGSVFKESVKRKSV